MVQGEDYLNHTWHPHPSARRFEYSTSPTILAAPLEANLRSAVLSVGAAKIQKEIFRPQDRLLQGLDSQRYAPLFISGPHRSAILSVLCQRPAKRIMKEAAHRGVFVSARCGYLRLAPHWCTTVDDRVLALLNTL